MRLPLKIIRHPESYEVRDAVGTHIAYIYFEDDLTRREQTKRLTQADAEQITKRIARLLTDAAGTR